MTESRLIDARVVDRLVDSIGTAIRVKLDKPVRDALLTQAEELLPMAGQTFGIGSFNDAREQARELEIAQAGELLAAVRRTAGAFDTDGNPHQPA